MWNSGGFIHFYRGGGRTILLWRGLRCYVRSCVSITILTTIWLRLIFLFPLHTPVLEPDLDLSLRETQSVGNLDPPSSGQVAVEVEFLLQLERLVPRISLPSSLPLWNTNYDIHLVSLINHNYKHMYYKINYKRKYIHLLYYGKPRLILNLKFQETEIKNSIKINCLYINGRIVVHGVPFKPPTF